MKKAKKGFKGNRQKSKKGFKESPTVYVGQKDYMGREIIAQTNLHFCETDYRVMFAISKEEGIAPFEVDRWHKANGKVSNYDYILTLNANHSFLKEFELADENGRDLAMSILSALAMGAIAFKNEHLLLGIDEAVADAILDRLFTFMSLPLGVVA
ncbi:MAG: hypothetical protein J1E16_00560 [Muribaculaceae bacterium]|nr:hypothetical protein [Muribaculaceae bacterium]